MKNKLLFALSVICLTALKTYSQEKASSVLRLKGVTIENDYHEKITWVKSKPIPLVEKDFTVSAYDCSYIQLYFGLYMEDSVQKITPIRIVNAYKNSNWIFFDEVSYLLGSRSDIREGKGQSFKLFDSRTRTKVEKGVSEKSDVVASAEILKFILYIVNNPETRMECRYVSNKNREQYTLVVNKGTKPLKKSFEALVEAYNQVTAEYSLENQLTTK
jgi:hypothetical protein